MAVVTVEELAERQSEIKGRIAAIDTEYEGRPLPDAVREEWNELNEEFDRNESLKAEMIRRRERVEELAGREETQEREDRAEKRETKDRTAFSRRLRTPDDPFDVAAYRGIARSVDDLPQLYRQGAEKVLERAQFPHLSTVRKLAAEGERSEAPNREDVQEHIEGLLDRHAQGGEVAERILITGSERYRRAFFKKATYQDINAEEAQVLARAASLTTTAGGFAVPYTLDPSIIPTSNYVVNPIRRVARVDTMVGNEWRGITSDGVVMAYAAEATETSDNAPALQQPTANAEKYQGFIPFSIEIGQDWGAFESEMGRLFADAKDELESAKFLVGTGHAANQPEGLLVGATAILATAGATLLAVGDLYGLEEALPPRYRPRASILANKKQFNRVRAFDTSGGSSLWVQLGQGLPASLLGYPNYEWSDMSSAITSGASIVTIGDFSYFLIADRIGLDVELIPHLFGGSNRFPTGQRGLYAWGRNTSKVLSWKAFRTLKVT
jgi:HK97 family phage major capsid protein